MTAPDGLAVVFSEASDGLEVGHQPPGQPHQLDFALEFSFQASARLDAVEIAVNVDLLLDRWVVSRPASVGWDSTVTPKETRLSSSNARDAKAGSGSPP